MGLQLRQKNHLAYNLATLRKQQRLTEQVAERIGVTRQAVAKWETGEHAGFDQFVMHWRRSIMCHWTIWCILIRKRQESSVPPKDKHLFGTVQIGERGQLVISKKARELLGYKPGDMLVVLGDTTPGADGLALMASDVFLSAAQWAIDTR